MTQEIRYLFKAAKETLVSDGADLQREIRLLLSLNAKIDEVLNGDDTDRKMQLVELRRKLAVQFGRTSEAGRRIVEAPQYQHFAAEFRERIGQMRSTLATHQANWPAVSIDNRNSAYQQSLADFRRARHGFLDWAKANMPS